MSENHCIKITIVNTGRVVCRCYAKEGSNNFGKCYIESDYIYKGKKKALSVSVISKIFVGISLAVQWLGFHTFTTEGMGSVPASVVRTPHLY